jgi:hypothetical protein
MLDLVVGHGNARKMRDVSDGCSVDGHSSSSWLG